MVGRATWLFHCLACMSRSSLVYFWRMRFHLIATIDHDVTGELAWRDKRIPFNTPYGPIGGFGLIHDCFEHFRLETVSDEVEAHGALYWARYLGAYCYPGNGRNLSLDDIGSEWIQLYHAIESGHSLAKPPRTCKLDDDCEADISTIVENGLRSLRSEGLENWKVTDEIEQNFRGWFRIGFRKAEKRYRKLFGWDNATTAHYFEQAIRKYENTSPEYEGQEMVAILDKNGFRLQEVEAEVY